MHVTILYNQPTLEPGAPDRLSEAGVLESVEAVSEVMATAGHQVRLIAVGADPEPLLEALRAGHPQQVVVNLCEAAAGDPAGEIWVAGLLEWLGLPFTGSPSSTLALVRDKARTGWLLRGAGLLTPDSWLVPAGAAPPAELASALARGPLFVKPAAEDASLGIGQESVIADLTELRARIELVHHNWGAALVEPFIPGRELNLGVIALPDALALPPAEIQFQCGPEHRWPVVSYEAKWESESAAYKATPVVCPAVLEPALAASLGEVALAAFKLSGCRDYARIDVRLDAAGRPVVLEVNANPDLAPSAGLVRALRTSGREFAPFVLRMVELAAARAAAVRPDRSRLADARPSSSTSAVRILTGPAAGVRAMDKSDPERLLDILRACGLFRADEIVIARELLDEAAAHGDSGHYQVRVVADPDGRAIGWSCHGRVPMTDATWDLYWMAVEPAAQGQGIGRRLLASLGSEVRAAGGRWLVAETSTLDAYAPTRAFYRHCGFLELGRIPDFYRPADGRVTFGLRLDEPAPGE